MITDSGKRCFINMGLTWITMEYDYLNTRKRKQNNEICTAYKQLRSQKGVLSSEILENFVVFGGRNHINDREKLN